MSLAGLAGLASAHVVKYPTGSMTIEYANSDDPAADEMDYFSGRVEASKSSSTGSSARTSPRFRRSSGA